MAAPGYTMAKKETQGQGPRTLVGSIGQKKLGDFRFSLFSMVFNVIFGSSIIPRWLINDSGWISILFGSFLELPKIDQIWTRGPIFITKTIQKIQ